MRGHTANQDVGLVESCDPVFIIKAERGDGLDTVSSFYCSEPELLDIAGNEKEWCGGFGPISGAITFTDGSKARTARNRLAKKYRDLPIEMKVLRRTRKEMFQSRLK
jgi:hypothetical protein